MRDYLGVDPGRRGAVALLRGNRVIAAAVWKPSTRRRVDGFRVHLYPDNARTFVETFHELSVWLSLRLRAHSFGAWGLAVEEAFVRLNASTAIKISRNAGEISGPLSANAISKTRWVRASVWRKRVLGLSPFTRRGKAKLASMQFVPPLLDSFDDVVDVLGSTEDLYDAAGIALWLSQTEEER